MPAAEWSTAFTPVGTGGAPLPPEGLPLVIALARRVPAHRSFAIRRSDGDLRDVGVTAFPLFAHTEEFVGAMAIFWDRTGEA